MNLYSGKSAQLNVEQAIIEVTADWPSVEHLQGGIIFCFYPQAEQGKGLAEGLAQRFPGMVIAGCSTAGEWLDGHHYDGNIVMMAIFSKHIRWSVVAIEQLDQLTDGVMESSLQTLLSGCGMHRSDMSSGYQTCVTMVDGLSMQEEKLSAMLAKHLQGMPILGGSSGDGLRFEQTSLLIQTVDQPCRVVSNSALLLLIDSDAEMQPIKHQHFDISDRELVITLATPEKRMVHTLNGMKAAECYAESVGCAVCDLSPDVFSDYPLIYSYRDEYYVRSIQKAQEDGSLTFYCAIEEGLILNLAQRKDMEAEFIESLSVIGKHSSQAHTALVFNCILRSLESKHLDCCQSLTRQLQVSVPHYIGFDTYGEQWNGLHINQTFTALILREPEELCHE